MRRTQRFVLSLTFILARFPPLLIPVQLLPASQSPFLEPPVNHVFCTPTEDVRKDAAGPVGHHLNEHL
jgi:hypothetical protein